MFGDWELGLVMEELCILVVGGMGIVFLLLLRLFIVLKS